MQSYCGSVVRTLINYKQAFEQNLFPPHVLCDPCKTDVKLLEVQYVYKRSLKLAHPKDDAAKVGNNQYFALPEKSCVCNCRKCVCVCV